MRKLFTGLCIAVMVMSLGALQAGAGNAYCGQSLSCKKTAGERAGNCHMKMSHVRPAWSSVSPMCKKDRMGTRTKCQPQPSCGEMAKAEGTCK